MGYIKAIAVHRAAFQGMHQQQEELYQAYAARLKAKAELCQYRIVARACKKDLCNCSRHNRQLYYRDEMVGTQLEAGAFNKEHQDKLLSKTNSLHSLEDKLCVLQKSDSSSATLSGQIQPTAVVKVEPSKCSTCHTEAVVEVKTLEPSKCSICHKVHKECAKCQRKHPCTIDCHNCKKAGRN